MNNELLDCAKITRPEIKGLYCRERLFETLEQNLTCPVIWITGPAGSGKTALITSYVKARNIPCLWYKVDSNDLDQNFFFNYMGLAARKASPRFNSLPALSPENQNAIREYAHNFFTSLFSLIERPSFLVFDDYQKIPEETVLNDYILESLKWLPDDIKIIFVSRNQPSSKFSRLIANQEMSVLRGQDLQFTCEEFFGLAKKNGINGVRSEILDTIFASTDGWAAGQHLLLEKVKKDSSASTGRSVTFKEIHQYIDEEIFKCLDIDVQHFLLKTSLFPNVTSSLAQDMTGFPNSESILKKLDHHNLFIEQDSQHKDATYRYHPVFREYLAGKLDNFFPPGELKEFKRHAAFLLLDTNQIEEAADLLCKVGDCDGFIEIIANNAPALLAQGKHLLLEKWLTTVPQDKTCLNPWLSYWLGACLQPSNPSEATKNFNRAFDSFYGQRQIADAFSAWAGMVNSIIMEWDDFTRLDPLIYWLEFHYKHESSELTDETRSQVISSMTRALMIRRPYKDDITSWVALALTKAQETKDVNHKIQACVVAAEYYMWLGDQSNCWFLLGKIKGLCRSSSVSPLIRIHCKLLEAGIHAWYQADTSKCLQAVKNGLGIADSSGIHILDHMLYVIGACGALLEGNYAKASDFLQSIEDGLDDTRRHCLFCYHYTSTWLSHLRANNLRAVKHVEETRRKSSETGYVFHKALGHYATAQVLFKNEEVQGAIEHLEQFAKIADTTGSLILQFMCALSKAQFFLDQGKLDDGLEYLRQAMKLGSREKYHNLLLWWDPAPMTRLYMKALEHDIEPEYVKTLITERDLVPDFPPVDIEQWPWPLKIYTLGRFELVINGKPVQYKGKAQQKPLNMLKALITLGGRGVSALKLADVLWPDADGDMQNQSLATTLHRLRRILGKKKLIEFNDGHLSLNPRYCWVDAWAFERLLSQAESEAMKKEEKNTIRAISCAEKSIDLYKGNFLPQNNMEYSCVHMREHLKSRFLRGITLLGRNFEKMDEKEKAVVLYQKALEVDPMMEEFYQRLMLCYQRLGRNAEAVSAYKRCQKNFTSVLRVEPSSQTKAIYKSIGDHNSNKD